MFRRLRSFLVASTRIKDIRQQGICIESLTYYLNASPMRADIYKDMSAQKYVFRNINI